MPLAGIHKTCVRLASSTTWSNQRVCVQWTGTCRGWVWGGGHAITCSSCVWQLIVAIQNLCSLSTRSGLSCAVQTAHVPPIQCDTCRHACFVLFQASTIALGILYLWHLGSVMTCSGADQHRLIIESFLCSSVFFTRVGSAALLMPIAPTVVASMYSQPAVIAVRSHNTRHLQLISTFDSHSHSSSRSHKGDVERLPCTAGFLQLQNFVQSIVPNLCCMPSSLGASARFVLGKCLAALSEAPDLCSWVCGHSIHWRTSLQWPQTALTQSSHHHILQR